MAKHQVVLFHRKMMLMRKVKMENGWVSGTLNVNLGEGSLQF